MQKATPITVEMDAISPVPCPLDSSFSCCNQVWSSFSIIQEVLSSSDLSLYAHNKVYGVFVEYEDYKLLLLNIYMLSAIFS